MNILLFGGTTEGRILAARLTALGAKMTVSVATELGREELVGLEGIRILLGKRTKNDMQQLLQQQDLCIDATHPYAVEASANIRAACRDAQVPLRRLLRAESHIFDALHFGSAAEAAAYLTTQSGNILITIGTKELPAFAALDKTRLFARVLPTHAALTVCESMGLPHRNILALQGPFSQKLNEAMLEQYNIRWLISKDGGAEGGFAEKQAAAQAANVQLLLIGRPRDEGEDLETLYQSMREVLL